MMTVLVYGLVNVDLEREINSFENAKFCLFKLEKAFNDIK